MKINGNIVSCAGNFALRARCKFRTARNLIGSREAKNAQAVFLLSETLGDCCAGNFALRAR